MTRKPTKPHKRGVALVEAPLRVAAKRISVAVHIAAAQEIAEALGLSVAADPRE